MGESKDEETYLQNINRTALAPSMFNENDLSAILEQYRRASQDLIKYDMAMIQSPSIVIAVTSISIAVAFRYSLDRLVSGLLLVTVSVIYASLLLALFRLRRLRDNRANFLKDMEQMLKLEHLPASLKDLEEESTPKDWKLKADHYLLKAMSQVQIFEGFYLFAIPLTVLSLLFLYYGIYDVVMYFQ